MNRVIYCRRNSFAGWVLLLLGVILLNGCSNKRAVIKKPIKEKGEAFIVQQMNSHQFDFDFFAARFNAVLKSGHEKQAIKGQIRIRKDSAIWCSVAPLLGIEMARILITPDSVKMMNRMDHTVLLTSFDYLRRFLNKPVNFQMLQALLLGNDMPGFDQANFTASIDNMMYRLTAVDRMYVADDNNGSLPSVPLQKLWIDADSFKIIKMMLKEGGGKGNKLVAEYADFVKMGDQYVASSCDIVMDTPHKKMKLFLDFEKCEMEHCSFPFKVSSKYKVIHKL